MDAKLQEALKKANTEVEKSGITDPELKKIAFSKAVDFYLESHVDRKSPRPSHVDHQPRIPHTSDGDFWQSLSRDLGVDQNHLKDVYALKDKQVTLVIREVPGEAKLDKQRNLAALVLLAYQQGFGEEWVSSGLVAEAAKQSGLYDTSKFASNLKHAWFRADGVKKGLKYRLSGPGISHAKELLTGLTQ